jgi:K+-sensing histidine kinase KdpD
LNTHRPAFNAILRNLLSNAIKFSPEHSTIKVLAKQQAKNLILEVQDEGLGLSMEECEKINEEKTALFRSARTSEVHGKGYGLRMSQDFARVLGGRLSARIPTDREKGSTFRLVLPLNQEHTDVKMRIETENESRINR